MTNRILITGWEDRVRDRLGVQHATLPDEALRQPDVIKVAEAEVIGMVENWESLEGDARVFLEAATVVKCALQVITSMPARLPQEIKGPHSDVRMPVNWRERSEELTEELNRYIEMLQESQGQWVLATGLWLKGPQR